MYVAPEKDRAVWFVYKLEHYLNMPSPAFRDGRVSTRGKRLPRSPN